MEFHECYALDYSAARGKFIAAAKGAGARLFEYRNEHVTGPNDEPLFADVACIGEANATRRLVVISGTHGQEGFTGSAAQIAWMRTSLVLPPDVAVILIHALNPWGFAHYSRANENNVDLNRNFVDHDGQYPENPGYDELHGGIVLKNWSADALKEADTRFAQYEASHDKDALFDAFARGQYSHPDGLNYGGRSRQWSNLTLELIVKEHVAGAARVGFIDWHTGIGDYGKPFFLCFNEPSSGEFERAVQWWGSDRVRDQRPHGMTRPDYRGLVFHGIQQFLRGTSMAGAVIEFGTRGLRLRRALRLDLWLKFRANRSTDQYAMLHADMRDAFCPVEQAWRDVTILEGINITQQAVIGLASWD